MDSKPGLASVEQVGPTAGKKRINEIFQNLESWHNRKRRHSQLGWLTPMEFENNRIITVVKKSKKP